MIVQIIMASRVLYGLARQGSLPGILGVVDPRTRTPLIATLLVGAVVVTLASLVPMRGLAEATSRITLVIFALVNLALWNMKRRGTPAPSGVFVVPYWVPVAGFACCVLFLAAGG